MQFRKFRLAGFKSFVEPAEVEIAAGLTGIVGPNGCGKSNLVEGLRWVMGETSARRLRGGEMDDVIFGGAAGRPARNIAEVTLVIDNAARTAPAVFNAYDEIEVRRRIERGAGSDFRVNGKSVRARDVQLLFADAAIGASSPALVSQGRVAALIAAKPAERRYVLEDAAGIAGMQSRRHEAELKLQGAAANLQQIELLLEALQGQVANLKRQAWQVEKYRALAGQIQAAEALLLYIVWREAAEREALAAKDFQQAEAAVTSALGLESAAALRESEAEFQLPALRQAREQAHFKLRELTQREAALAAKRQQGERDLQAAIAEQAQAVQDRQAEEAAQASAAGSLVALQEETAALTAAAGKASKDIATARQQAAALADTAVTAETAALQLAGQVANDQAVASSLARQEAELQSRHTQAAATVQRLQAELAGLAVPDTAVTKAAQAAVEISQAKVAGLQADSEQAGKAQQGLREIEAVARQKANQAETALLQHKAALAGLERSLAAGAVQQDFPPVLAQVKVAPGYEAALAAALAADLGAAVAEQAPHRWRILSGGKGKPVPDSLANYVKAPAELQLALQAVLIAEPATALARQVELQPGQMLVTKEGALYRWDGLVREHAGNGAEAIQLAQRNDLERLAAALPALEKARATAAAQADKARQDMQAGATAERALLAQLSPALAEQRRAEQALSTAESAIAAYETRRLRAEDALQSASDTLERSAAELARVGAERAALPDLTVAQAELATAQQQRQAAREAAEQAVRTVRQLELAEEARVNRLAALGRESEAWEAMQGRGHQQLAALQARQGQAAARETAIRASLPGLAESLSAALDQLAAAEQAERQAGDALVTAEQEVATLRQATRVAQTILSEAREKRGGAEARLLAAREGVAEAIHQLQERCHLTPDAVTDSLLPEEAATDRGSCERRLAGLLREREALGAVNLRAETELAEVSGEVQRLEMEKADLLLAIERLRQAITTLNKEARERLLAAFETVQVQFRRLFTTLFGGGEAELTLTGLEDPLSAGLEIFASPPGKKLQMLSLLSGGEQALTALALLFAMFLATPAPVCVLDEVDAPLDDANVTRFCDLLDEISAATGTRFLVITHHRVTMARMDRLYGVTMAERGVSMLVSVDLKAAETMIES